MTPSTIMRGLTADRILVDSDKGVEFRPTLNRLLVRPKGTREMSKGGIVIPDSAKVEETMGEVIAAGRGVVGLGHEYIDRDPLYLPGDMVVFKEFTGVHITLDIDDQPEKFLILWDEDVLGVLTKAE